MFAARREKAYPRRQFVRRAHARHELAAFHVIESETVVARLADIDSLVQRRIAEIWPGRGPRGRKLLALPARRVPGGLLRRRRATTAAPDEKIDLPIGAK